MAYSIEYIFLNDIKIKLCLYIYIYIITIIKGQTIVALYVIVNSPCMYRKAYKLLLYVLGFNLIFGLYFFILQKRK